MRGLVWMVGIVAVAAAMYWANPPRWAESTVEVPRNVARSDSRSLVVRLAKAGQAMREREIRPAGLVVEGEGMHSFGAN